MKHVLFRISSCLLFTCQMSSNYGFYSELRIPPNTNKTFNRGFQSWLGYRLSRLTSPSTTAVFIWRCCEWSNFYHQSSFAWKMARFFSDSAVIRIWKSDPWSCRLQMRHPYLEFTLYPAFFKGNRNRKRIYARLTVRTSVQQTLFKSSSARCPPLLRVQSLLSLVIIASAGIFLIQNIIFITPASVIHLFFPQFNVKIMFLQKQINLFLIFFLALISMNLIIINNWQINF